MIFSFIFPRKEEKRYSFLAPETCSEDEPVRPDISQPDRPQLSQLPHDLYRDLRRSNQFQRLQEDGSRPQNQLFNNNSRTSSASAGGGGGSSRSGAPSNGGSGGDDGRLNAPSSVLARVSQLNLTRLSQYCSYSMFNNESTESLAETSQHSNRSSSSQLYQVGQQVKVNTSSAS